MGEASDRGGQTAETGMLKGSREPRAPEKPPCGAAGSAPAGAQGVL